MGLNAKVCCDCYEAGRVKVPPPQPELVYIDPETGEVSLRWEEPGADMHRFYEWRESACEHRGGNLVYHRLGNMGGIGFLRALFQETPEQFPTLLSKVVYNGIHGGDALCLSDVEGLSNELSAVRALYCADESDEAYLREFEAHLMELTQAAQKVRKPIVF